MQQALSMSDEEFNALYDHQARGTVANLSQLGDIAQLRAAQIELRAAEKLGKFTVALVWLTVVIALFTIVSGVLAVLLLWDRFAP